MLCSVWTSGIFLFESMSYISFFSPISGTFLEVFVSYH